MAPQRITELRKGFTETLADKELIAEAVKVMKEEPSPSSGEEMQRIMSEMYATPEPIVDRLRNVLKK